MENIELWLLPALTLLVIVASYWMNLALAGDGKKIALHEAFWWGGGFFVYGLLDYLLLGIPAL